MNIRRLFRIGLFACLLWSAVASSSDAAVLLLPRATPYRVTTGAAQSSVDVVISNPNSFDVYVEYILQVRLSNGVTRTWPAVAPYVPKGNTSVRVTLPFAIEGVNWARVTNVKI